MDERLIFKGSENPLKMLQKYTHDFQCSFDLKTYPFDRQVSSFLLPYVSYTILSNTFEVGFIKMTVDKYDKSTIKLIPHKMMMLQNVDLMLYHIKNWDLAYIANSRHYEGIQMTIHMRRKIMSEMMTTYLPSILLLMITFATTFFKPVYFEAALTVNLTNMLVMTTIFMSVMERLPTTSYLKMIDYWLVFCQLVPFTEVIS